MLVLSSTHEVSSYTPEIFTNIVSPRKHEGVLLKIRAPLTCRATMSGNRKGYEVGQPYAVILNKVKIPEALWLRKPGLTHSGVVTEVNYSTACVVCVI